MNNSLFPLPASLRVAYGFGTDFMRQLKVCPCCGTPCKATKKRCNACGARLPKDTLYQSYKNRSPRCANCDMVVPKGAVYCPGCGAYLK